MSGCVSIALARDGGCRVPWRVLGIGREVVVAVLRRLAMILVAVALIGAVFAACGDDESGGGAQPTTTEATSPPATTEPPTDGIDAADPVAAGLEFFKGTCAGCHLGNGTEAGGVGPQLEGRGVDEQRIRDQVTNGGNQMPAGLASGTDLDNVTAYVLSLQ